MELYVIRHGQTDANLNKIAVSERQVGLNSTGVTQVEILSSHFNQLHVVPSTIYSSNLLRAVQTAQILNTSVHTNIVIDTRLKEISYGTLEGASREIITQAEFGYNSAMLKEAGGESIIEVERRVASWLDLVTCTNDQVVFCVSHGLTISVLIQILLKKDRTFINIVPHHNADYSHITLLGCGSKLHVEKYALMQLKGPLF